MRRRDILLHEATASYEEARPGRRSGRDGGPTHGRWVVATGLQGALRTLNSRDGRGNHLGLHGGRVQGGSLGGAPCGWHDVARDAGARLSLSPPPALVLPVRVSGGSSAA